MDWQIITVFALLALALVLFIWERWSFDVVALLLVGVLMLTGILRPSQGLSGFSNPATVTIGAMFVLSEGLRRTGALVPVEELFLRLGEGSWWKALLVIMPTVAVVSAFVNNTAAMVVFIPVILRVSADLGVSPSKILMPVSFASMLGGVCTLIGTSTNILVSGILQERGMAAIGMFEFAPVGVVFLVVGLGALVFTARFVPARRGGEDLTTGFEMKAFLTEVEVTEESGLAGLRFDREALREELEVDILAVTRPDGEVFHEPGEELRVGDVLRVRGGARDIQRLLERAGLAIRPARIWSDVELEKGEDVLVEAVISPDSSYESRLLGEIDLPSRYGALVLAIRHRGELQQEDMSRVRLSGGDSLLLTLPQERVEDLQHDRSFVVASTLDVRAYRREKLPLALAVMAGVVLTAAVGLVPIVVSAVCGVVLLLGTRCLTTEEAYEAVNWKVIFLLAGVIPLGVAMDETGAAELMADAVLALTGSWGPRAAVAGLFFLTVVLTSVVSNQATAAVLAPVAIQAAAGMGVDPMPLVMTVTYAASLSFMTPVGYQTNTLIYGPGQYAFLDFTRLGLPLDILLGVLATLLIPLAWPF